MTYCRICGGDCEPNPRGYWDPDDGWHFGTLCRGCARAYGRRRPRRDDFAKTAPPDVLRAARR